MGKIKNVKKPSKLSQDLKTMDKIAETEVANATKTKKEDKKAARKAAKVLKMAQEEIAVFKNNGNWSDPLVQKNSKKRTVMSIDMDHPLFGGHVSDDDSFKPEAQFIRSDYSGQFGAFVGDGQEVVINLGFWTSDSSITFDEVFVMTDKEARRVGEMLITMADSARKARKAQEAHRDSLPTKSK